MKNYLDRIMIDPLKLDGKPCIRGLRVSVQTILEFLGAGDNEADVLRHYPFLEKEDILACIQYAAVVTGKEVNYQSV